MSTAMQIGLIAGALAALVGVMGAVGAIARRYGWPAELQRKCIHVATGLFALSLPLIFSAFPPVFALVALALLLMFVLRMPSVSRSSLGATVHGVKRRSYGELMLALAVGFIFYFSVGNPIVYVLPIAVLTISDSAAALIGTHYGRRHFSVEAGTKSIEGVAMFFLVTWIVALIMLLMLTDIGKVNVVLLSFLVAAFGALVEADSWRGFDNLFVPVGLHLFLATHLNTQPKQLLLLAAGFITILIAVHLFAARVGLTSHAARGYTILVFLICAVTAPHNAILPIVAVIAHLAARRLRPCRSHYPDLDFLSVVVGVALFWLFIGEYAAKNALSVYNLTFAGAALVFLTLAGGWRAGFAGIAAAALFAAIMGIASLNAFATQWQGTLWPWVALSFGICLALPTLRPALFDRYRAPRALAVAGSIPLLLFIVKAIPT